MHPASTQSHNARWHAAHGHRGDLIAQGISRGLSRQEAEDVASESILRAGVKEDLDVDRAGGWLRTVAHNLAVDLYRTRPSERVRERLKHQSMELAEPQVAIDDWLEAQWVASVVEALPDRQRHAVHYRAAGYTVEQIAEGMDSTYKAVESLLSKARATVRKAITATLGLLGAVLVGRRRGLTTPSYATTAVVATFAVWFAAGSLPPSNESEPMEPPAVAARPHPIAPTVIGLDSRRQLRSSARPQTAPPPPPTLTRQVLPPGDAGPLRHGGLSVTRSQSNESLQDSVKRCIAHGIALDPHHLGCQ